MLSHLLFYDSLCIVKMHQIIHDITLQRDTQTFTVPFHRSENQDTDYFSNDAKATNGELSKTWSFQLSIQ